MNQESLEEPAEPKTTQDWNVFAITGLAIVLILSTTFVVPALGLVLGGLSVAWLVGLIWRILEKYFVVKIIVSAIAGFLFGALVVP